MLLNIILSFLFGYLAHTIVLRCLQKLVKWRGVSPGDIRAQALTILVIFPATILFVSIDYTITNSFVCGIFTGIGVLFAFFIPVGRILVKKLRERDGE